MLTTPNLKNIYSNIQKQLYYMIPEKWDKIYLYASVVDHYNNIQTGEMFFYYYPKSMLKKNPINVYEIPSKFNIDENGYLKLAENLYNEIKQIRKKQIEEGKKPWSSVTISIEECKFTVEFDYEDLINSKFSNTDRHLVWRHKYLNIPLESYSKSERAMIKKYIDAQKKLNRNLSTYTEGVYQKASENLLEHKKKIEEGKIKQTKEIVEETPKTRKNQILNI